MTEKRDVTALKLTQVGWRNVSTGKLFVLVPGTKPVEHDVGPEWEPIYVKQ